MKNSEINDPLFRRAVEAIDNGDIASLESLLSNHPQLVQEPLNYPSGDYFQHPYLLWFTTGNPIRTHRLPSNIIDVTRLVITYLKKLAAENLTTQLNYAVGLVSTGRLAQESGKQIALLDLLIESGGKPGGALNALAHGNNPVAEYHLKRGEKLSLAVSVGLDLAYDVVTRLAVEACPDEKLLALTVASYSGHTQFISLLLSMGTDPNAFPPDRGFHKHGTPLHQAVASGSLPSVKLLVQARARIDLKDLIYHETPLDWARHLEAETQDPVLRKQFSAIRQYLTEEKNR